MSRIFNYFAIALGVVFLGGCRQVAPTSGLSHVRPAEVGLDEARLELIDSTVQASIEAEDIPGAVVAVMRNDKIAFLRAYGNKQVVPDTIPMTTETLFDMASVSKCVGTTLSFMQLIEQGKVLLTDKVKQYIPEFEPWEDPDMGEKVDITVQDLLTHASGLDAYISVPKFVKRYGRYQADTLVRYIATEVGRNFRPGTDYKYSCLNFVTLQAILERVTGERLCDYAQKHVFDVLGLEHTTYFPIKGEPSNPRAEELKPLCAPTTVQKDGKPFWGVVHDPIARAINGGNSGNAGVFSCAEDLCVIASAILNGGSYRGRRILAPETVRLMMSIPPANDPKIGRALGWDTYGMNPVTSGDIFTSPHTFGHTGYTGTSIVMEPRTRTAVIILSNRVHPKDDGSAARLRATVGNIVAGAIRD